MTHTYIQAIKQPTFGCLTRSVRRVKEMSENVGNIVVEAMQPEMTLGLLLSRNSTRQTQVGIDIFQGPASNKSMKSDHSTQA